MVFLLFSYCFSFSFLSALVLYGLVVVVVVVRFFVGSTPMVVSELLVGCGVARNFLNVGITDGQFGIRDW